MTKSETYNIYRHHIQHPHSRDGVQARNFGGGSRGGAKREIRQQSVEVRLLCLIEEVARVQNRVIRLWGTCSIKKNLLEEGVVKPS